jgi:hypothetical protein
LEEVGFILESKNERWKRHIKELLVFKNVHGHFRVNSSYKENLPLVRWVDVIRCNPLYKLSPSKVKELDKLGFHHRRDASTGLLNMAALRDSQKKKAVCCDKKWKLHIQELLAFKKSHGHCEVPVNMKENLNLAKWVRSIRGSRYSRVMSAKRMEELDNIGLQHGRDPSTGLGFDIDSRKKIRRKRRKHVHVPQDFQALNNGHCDDGFVSSGVSDGEIIMAPKVDRKKCLEEDFTKTDQPRRELPSQVRMVDLFDAVPMFKAQDLQHYRCFSFNDSANESRSEERREN